MQDLQTEIQQTKPFESPQVEAFLNLTRSQAVLSQRHDQLLKQHRLTPAMYNILRILRGAGTTGATCSDVASRLLTRVPDVTRLIDRLVARGWVKRRRTERDRRLVLLTLTAQGATILAEVDRPLQNVIESELAHMTSDELEALNRLLVKARKGPR